MAERPHERLDESTVRESYDRVPYPSGSIPQTHPDNLATRALLFGLEPPDLRRVRVLELGCSDGGNLIPMAAELPESRFVGIDLSPRQIEIGRAALAELEIGNVELREGSLLDIGDSGEDFGEFDYIVVHGVYSWVAPEVQDAILRVCRERLAPRGVAYVSYNALPGWHQRLMLREMMLWHTRGDADPLVQAGRSIELMELLAQASAGGPEEAHAAFLRGRFEHLSEFRHRPSYIVHEYLEESNHPVYLHQFMAGAARHGLQYLADAETELGEIDSLPPAAAERLRALARDRVELEQYVDFARNRTFRRTLLCREGLPLELKMVPERMRRFHASSPLRPAVEAPDVRSATGVTFQGERGKTFTVSHPLTKALLVALAAAWPRPLSFDELLDESRVRLGGEPDATIVADILFTLYGGAVLELHLLPPRCVERVSERPVGWPLARRQAVAGPLITNLRRRVLQLDDDVARIVLAHLDGRHDRAALAGVLEREVKEGRMRLTWNGEPLAETDSERLPRVLDQILDDHLGKMAAHALLMG